MKRTYTTTGHLRCVVRILDHDDDADDDDDDDDNCTGPAQLLIKVDCNRMTMFFLGRRKENVILVLPMLTKGIS